MSAAGCCSAGGDCELPAEITIFSNRDQYNSVNWIASAASVAAIEPYLVTLHVGDTDHRILVGPGTAAFEVGQQLFIDSCSAGQGPNTDLFLVVRDATRQLVLVSSGHGWMALDAPCVPQELSVRSVENNCCGRGWTCGAETPFSLAMRADNEVVLSSGRTGTLFSKGREYSAVVGLTVRQEDNGQCTDIVPYRASYIVYRVRP
jgi:hypothetical protein